MQEQHLYQARRALKESENTVSPEIASALLKARKRAVARAQEKQHGDQISRGWAWLRLWPSQAWGMGITAGSVLAVVLGLNLAEQVRIDGNLNRLASIDQKMISGPLPVQAYLDPGFLIFQESAIEQSSSAAQAGSAGASLMQRAAEMRNFWSAESLFPGLNPNQQGPSWSKLSTAQKEALAPLESFWGEMEAHRKQKWIRIADRFHMLSPEQQALAQERMQEWVSMPANDRRQARAVFDGFKEIIPQEVQVMKWNEYQNLSAKERAQLMALAQERAAGAAGASAGSTGAANTNGAFALNTNPKPHSALSRHSDKPFAAQ